MNITYTKQLFTTKLDPFLAAHPEMTLQDIGGFDEFMFDLNASLQHGKCVAPPGHLFTATPGERSEHVTVVAGHCGTWAAPMLIIFKGKNYNPDWERKVEKLFPELYRNGYIKITQDEVKPKVSEPQSHRVPRGGVVARTAAGGRGVRTQRR